MDISTYMDKQKQLVGDASKKIKDLSVFDFNYIPDQPVMREEAKALIDEMVQFEVTGLPDHHAVIGSRGSGKTLMLKYLQRVVPQHADLDAVYVNCRHQNTTFKILAHLVDGETGGFSLPELYERFLAKHRKKTVVILDEIDLMSPKDKRREILYLLSRSEQPYMVIMLSNGPQVLKQLDGATRSSLQPIPVYFKNYDAQQLQQILADRAKQGLHSWDNGQLAEIAALTTRMANADTRVALKTLKYTVTMPGQSLMACFERARQDVVIDMICDLSDAILMILWAVASSRSKLAKDVYERYCRFSQSQRAKPFSYVYFCSNLSFLQSAGLVGLIATKVDRTYTKRVMLTCEASVVASIAKLRFEVA